MCGILFSCSVFEHEQPSEHRAHLKELLKQLRDANAARGPDAQDAIVSQINKLTLEFFSSELRLRGSEPVSQPHRSDDGHILCWNGEIFEGLEVLSDENDGVKLFDRLRATHSEEKFRDELGRIEGPYAIVYYHPHLRRVFFARDPLGRRSLLIHIPTSTSPSFVLTSVSTGYFPLLTPEELSTECIHYLDVDRLNNISNLDDFHTCLGRLSRQNDSQSLAFAEPCKVNTTLPGDPPRTANLDDIPPHLATSVDDLIAHLDRSVKLQTQNIPRRSEEKGKARVAVLFSGGIDSTMLAFLADRHVDPEDPIDLLNVAFENPRKILVKAEGNIGALPKRERKAKMKDRLDYTSIDVVYDVPDRLTGRQELEELRRLCPKRTWNFVEVDVPYEESQAARPHVEALMYPGRTIMDLSLAVALYFAARGKGHIRAHPGANAEPYVSTAKVLLNGLGSDELLGGYGRHRAVFNVDGWPALISELQLEIDRIPTRNLGRDDRVISSHGKETRHPFLSLSVVAFLAQLPVHHKLDPRLAAGLGEKMLLRLAARKVGLVEASARKKRAMQFGSHSARMGPGESDGKGDIKLGEQ
ncbi:hypothetical protein EIP91_012276 [Steccherinum ochraceum]|uniref:Glutamine amidotransferase type-2 domain-containing protein n=1 Tax=Steccherinum ochraceum TaxID=92696 RepID=A0A4R0RK65_9APHY|nr:hypothetical protein EIP91_012276 [Steccherinum ochraceum]